MSNYKLLAYSYFLFSLLLLMLLLFSLNQFYIQRQTKTTDLISEASSGIPSHVQGLEMMAFIIYIRE